MMTNSFLPAKLNFPIWQGATFRYAFQWLDEEPEGKRKAHDLTGFGGRAILRADTGEVFELVSAPFSEGDGRIFFRPGSEGSEEPTEGFVQMYIDAEQTKEFAWKKATYELLLKEGGVPKEAAEPDVFPMLTGVFTLSRPGRV